VPVPSDEEVLHFADDTYGWSDLLVQE